MADIQVLGLAEQLGQRAGSHRMWPPSATALPVPPWGHDVYPRALGCWVLGSNNTPSSLAGTPPGLLVRLPCQHPATMASTHVDSCAADTEVPPHGLLLPRRLRLEEMTSLALESEHPVFKSTLNILSQGLLQKLPKLVRGGTRVHSS